MLRSVFRDAFDENAVFGAPEAAGILKVHAETLRDFIRTGRFPAVRIGNRYRIGGWALNIALREGVPIDPLEAQRVFAGKDMGRMVRLFLNEEPVIAPEMVVDVRYHDHPIGDKIRTTHTEFVPVGKE